MKNRRKLIASIFLLGFVSPVAAIGILAAKRAWARPISQQPDIQTNALPSQYIQQAETLPHPGSYSQYPTLSTTSSNNVRSLHYKVEQPETNPQQVMGPNAAGQFVYENVVIPTFNPGTHQESQTAVLMNTYRKARSDEHREQIRSQMKENLNKQFDSSIEKAEADLKQLEERLTKARANIAKRIANKSAIVEARMKTLLGDRDELAWDYDVVGLSYPAMPPVPPLPPNARNVLPPTQIAVPYPPNAAVQLVSPSPYQPHATQQSANVLPQYSPQILPSSDSAQTLPPSVTATLPPSSGEEQKTEQVAEKASEPDDQENKAQESKKEEASKPVVQ